MAEIRSFRELKVWQRAMDLAMEIFEITEVGSEGVPLDPFSGIHRSGL